MSDPHFATVNSRRRGGDLKEARAISGGGKAEGNMTITFHTRAREPDRISHNLEETDRWMAFRSATSKLVYDTRRGISVY